MMSAQEMDPALREARAQHEAELMAHMIRQGQGWELIGFTAAEAEEVRAALERRTGLSSVVIPTDRSWKLVLPEQVP